MGSIESCPHCQMPYGGSFMHIHSGLGAPTFFCGLCGKDFCSHRLEWPDLNLTGRARYLAASIVYAGFVAIVHGGLTRAIISNVTGIPFTVGFDDFWKDPLFVACMVVAAAIVLLFQWYRVRRSIGRWMSDPPYRQEAYFLSTETNRQVMTIGVAILLGIIMKLT